MYSLEFLEEALKEFVSLERATQKIIKEKLLLLVDNPDKLKNNIKSLKGKYSKKFRLRVGDYRIVYEKDDNKIVIIIVRIGHRKEIY